MLFIKEPFYQQKVLYSKNGLIHVKLSSLLILKNMNRSNFASCTYLLNYYFLLGLN